MTTKLLVRQGGGAATEVDFANDFNPRKGAPFFQENTPLLRMGQRWADGEAAQGEFLVVDPNATESTAGFRIRPWAEVRLTEDASGDELTLAWMRFTSRDVQRRGLYVPGDEVEHTPQLMDCNVDLRGIPFRNGWERPAETDIERLEALFERKLSGSSSTAPNIFRITTDITFDSFANGHLAEHNTPVDMEAWTYPPGTEVSEVLAHIADEAGKQWGVVLHHDGGSTHKCLLYVDDEDLDRWTTAVRISDDSADWDPDDPTAPTFEPHWLQGAGREADFNEVITGLINIYGGTTEDPRTVYVETGEAPEDQETWVGVRNDDETRTEGGANRHANHYLTNHRNPRQSNKVSILVKAAQAHLVTAGQAIQIKSVVTNTGADKETFKWRRVAECIVEPAADGLYWLHLSLERPRKGFGGGGSGGGRGQPAATSPKPPPACEVPAGDVEVCSYVSDTDGDGSPTWPGGYTPVGVGSSFDTDLPGFAPYMVLGSGQTEDLIASCSLVPGNTYHISVHAGTNSRYATYQLRYNQNAGPTNQIIQSIYPNSEDSIEFDIGGNFTVDPSASEFSIVFSSTYGGWHYNEVLITEAAPEPDNDEFCIDPSLPADSPYYLPSDTVQALIDQAVAQGIADAIPWFNVKLYGALGDGETDDTDAINSAIEDVNLHGAGILYFPAGVYQVDSALTTITAAVTIRGDGSMSFDGAEWGTRIVTSSGSTDLFTLTGKIGKVEHIGFHCISGSDPTAGSAVHTDGAYLEQKIDFEDVHSRGFWYGFDIEVGAQWSMVNCQITAPKKYGVYIRNTVNGDAGDWSIVNCNFNAHAYNADAAIRMESSGGGKIANTKINMGFPAGSKFVNGIDFSIAGQTVILEVTNCSIENVTGHAIAGSVPTGSAFFRHINIHGNQVGLYSNNTGKAVSLVAGDAGDISEVIIADNIFHTTGTARSAIQLNKCDNVTLVANVLSGFNSLYTNTSSTNVTEISAGVTDHGALTGLTDDDHTQYLKETDVAAKGDLYAASANDTVGVLTVGTNGQVLTAASGETLGVKWSDPATAGNAVGPILIQDTPAGSPLVFADLLQNDDGDDLLYADV